MVLKRIRFLQSFQTAIASMSLIFVIFTQSSKLTLKLLVTWRCRHEILFSLPVMGLEKIHAGKWKGESVRQENERTQAKHDAAMVGLTLRVERFRHLESRFRFQFENPGNWPQAFPVLRRACESQRWGEEEKWAWKRPKGIERIDKHRNTERGSEIIMDCNFLLYGFFGSYLVLEM